MRFEGAIVREQGIVFAIVVVKRHILDNNAEANVAGGMRHRRWSRMILGMVGPLLVLAAALLMASFGWPTAWLLYPGLALMIAVSIGDLVSPPKRSFGGVA